LGAQLSASRPLHDVVGDDKGAPRIPDQLKGRDWVSEHVYDVACLPQETTDECLDRGVIFEQQDTAKHRTSRQRLAMRRVGPTPAWPLRIGVPTTISMLTAPSSIMVFWPDKPRNS
jgi:hypothetical protein